jgi:hypothetical protein
MAMVECEECESMYMDMIMVKTMMTLRKLENKLGLSCAKLRRS